MLMPSEFSASAGGRSAFSTSSGTMAWNGGELIAAPVLSKNAASSSTWALTRPASASTSSVIATASIQSCAKIR